MYPLFFTLKLYTYFMNLMDGWPSLWKEKKKWLFPLKFHKTCVNFVHLFFFWCFVHPTPKQGLRSKSFRYKNILKPFCSSRLLASPWLLCLKSVEATIGQLLVLQMRRERETEFSSAQPVHVGRAAGCSSCCCYETTLKALFFLKRRAP